MTTPELDGLTLREREVLAALASGCTTEQVGRTLGISHATARTHRQNVIRKLGARTIAHACAMWGAAAALQQLYDLEEIALEEVALT